MTYADAIEKRLLTICEKENITVNKLCALSGVSHTTIQDIMTGKTKNITLRTLHRLAV